MLKYCSMRSNQVFCFILTLRYFNVNVHLFYIPVKVISKQAGTLFLISESFSIFSIWFLDPQINHHLYPYHILDSAIYYIKGCLSINKQFSIDSFLDWEGHCLVCISSHTPSSDHSISNAKRVTLTKLAILMSKHKRNCHMPLKSFKWIVGISEEYEEQACWRSQVRCFTHMRILNDSLMFHS